MSQILFFFIEYAYSIFFLCTKKMLKKGTEELSSYEVFINDFPISASI